MTPNEMKVFKKRQQQLHDYNNAVLLGKMQGEAKGRAEGERKTQIEIARSLLDVLPVETISQTTGLSVEEIEMLRPEER